MTHRPSRISQPVDQQVAPGDTSRLLAQGEEARTGQGERHRRAGQSRVLRQADRLVTFERHAEHDQQPSGERAGSARAPARDERRREGE